MKDLIKALTIFLKYSDNESPIHCEHDVMYVCVNPSEVSEEDKNELEELGFNVDTSLDCFYSFKYGSC